MRIDERHGESAVERDAAGDNDLIVLIRGIAAEFEGQGARRAAGESADRCPSSPMPLPGATVPPRFSTWPGIGPLPV